ncbi:MAG: hypothetical protein MR030_08180 [Bacteroidales bacterium]|nr:hypothetical protein [Bacteroidales bacterium]
MEKATPYPKTICGTALCRDKFSRQAYLHLLHSLAGDYMKYHDEDDGY